MANPHMHPLRAKIIVHFVSLLLLLNAPIHLWARTTQLNACLNNLRQIDGAKEQLVLERKLSPTNIIDASLLLPYLKGGFFPICPSGGAYTIGNVSEYRSCSIPGHSETAADLARMK